MYLTQPDSLLLFDASAIAIAAAIFDLRHRRIPNWLTYSGIVLGMGLRSYFYGWRGLGSSLTGLAVTGGVFFVLYMLHAMGAGDIKLLAAVGAFAGPKDGLVVLMATAIAGAMMGVIYALYRGRLATTLKNVGSLTSHHVRSGLQEHPELNLGKDIGLRMPYGLAIATGTLYAFSTLLWR
jgi:prepilin peptidase CpaA